MATYTCYWPQSACADARAAGLEGEPLPVFFGGYNADSDFGRFKVAPGDTVIAVTVERGVLYLLASLLVEAKTLSAQWLADHPQHRRYGAARGGEQVLAGKPLSPLDFGRAVPAPLVGSFRYDSGKTGRPIKYFEAGAHATQPSELRASADGFVHLRCTIPSLTEGSVLSGVIASARRTFSRATRDREELSQICYEGRVPTRTPVAVPVT